jgi:capsular polysaccharide biosynthesis protein
MKDFDMRSDYGSGSSLYQMLYNQRRIVVSILLVGLIVAAALVFLTKPKYIATAKVLLVTDYAEQESIPKPLQADDLPTVALSDTVLIRFRKDLGEDITIEALRKRIRAKITPGSSILPVQYTGGSPVAAMRGANLLSDEIKTFYRQLATQRFDSLITELKAQTSAHARRLAFLDGKLQGAAKEYPYVDVSGSGESVYDRLAALRAQREELVSTVAADQSTATGSQALVVDARPPALREIVESDPTYRDLRDQDARDYAELQHVQAYGSNSYPGLGELNDTVTREHANLRKARIRAASPGPDVNFNYASARDAVAKASTQLQSDRSRAAIIDQQIAALDDQMRNGGVASRVAAIRRDREHEDAAYTSLAAHLSQAIASRAAADSTGSVTVMDYARFASRALFTTATYLAIALAFLSIWASVTLAVLLERGKEHSDELADLVHGIYDAPLLGSI